MTEIIKKLSIVRFSLTFSKRPHLNLLGVELHEEVEELRLHRGRHHGLEVFDVGLRVVEVLEQSEAVGQAAEDCKLPLG